MVLAIEQADFSGGNDKICTVLSKVGKDAADIIAFIDNAIPRSAAHLRTAAATPRAVPFSTLALPFSSAGELTVAGIERVNSDDSDEEEGLSDVDESAVEDMLLDEEESKAKTLIWDELTKDVIALVNERLYERRLKRDRQQPAKRRKKTPLAPVEHAEDGVKAALARFSPAGGKMNDNALKELFT